MRRRLSILTLICCSLLCTMVGVNGVLADTGTNGAGGNPGSGNSCGNSNLCYTSATGIRITLVNEQGERCYKSGNDLCVSSSTKNAKESKSIDYWFSSEDLPSFSNINGGRKCIAYNKKRTKSEFINAPSTDGIVACTDKAAYGTLYDIGGLGFPEILSKDKKADLDSKYLTKDRETWYSTNVTEARRMPVNVGNLVNFFQCSQDLENDDFTPKEFKDSSVNIDCSYQGTTVRKKIGDKIINNIIINAYNDDSLLISNNTNDTIYLQVEQLISLSLTPGSGYSVKDTVYMGTVAEVAFMFNKYYEQNTGFTHRFGLLGTKLGCNENYYENDEITQIGGGSSAITTGIMNGFYAKNKKATNMSTVIENISINSFLNGYINNDGQSTIKDNKVKEVLKKYYSDDTANIFSIWINPALGVNCDDDFQTLLSNKSNYFNANTGVDNGKLIAYLNKNKTHYQGLIKDCTNVDKNGNITSFKESCPLLSNTNKLSVTLSSGINTSTYGCKSNIECDDPLITSIVKKFDTVIKRIRQNIFVNGNEDYVDSNVPYRVLIGWLIKLFPNQDRLTDSVWAILGDNGPSCNSIPDCPGTSVELSCSDTNKTISSNTDPNCIKQGILYTTKSSGLKDLKSSINTAYTGECTNCKVYCDEKVNFDLSGQKELDNKITKAGTLLKWGRGKDSQIFGTMSVTQKCYVVPDDGYTLGVSNTGLNTKILRSHLGSPLAIDTKKLSGRYINTKITIDYTNPASYLKEPNNSLDQKVTLVAIPTNRGVLTVKHKGEKNSIDVNKNNPVSLMIPSTESLNYATTYSDNNYNKVEEFEVRANYVFAYGSYTGCTEYDSDGKCRITNSVNGGVDGKSELAWYTSKDDNGNFKTKEDYDNSSIKEKSSYTFIGYGLPTPFTSVTCIYDKENMSSNNSNKDKEPITVTIQNIGTSRITTSADDSNDYQFTKLLGTEKKLSYSCSYKVNNQIFGYENGDSIDCDYTSPKGLDVVFRPVELVNTSGDKEEQLDKAFPGMSGTGRKIGANWAEWENGNPDIVEDKANNIYNILSNAIYNEEPMYEITLDVATIQKIRKYNKSARKTTVNSEKADPYSNMPSIDGTDTNGYIGYVCSNNSDESYKYCASNFLTQLKADSKISGSCISGNYGTEGSKSRAHVYSHASNGCNQSWWN